MARTSRLLTNPHDPIRYTITIDLGRNRSVIQHYTEREMAYTEYQKLRAQGQFAGVWIVNIDIETEYAPT